MSLLVSKYNIKFWYNTSFKYKSRDVRSPTLYGVRAGEKFVKEIPKDILWKLFIMRLKTKERVFFLRKNFQALNRSEGSRHSLKARDLPSIHKSLVQHILSQSNEFWELKIYIDFNYQNVFQRIHLKNDLNKKNRKN